MFENEIVNVHCHVVWNVYKYKEYIIVCVN